MKTKPTFVIDCSILLIVICILHPSWALDCTEGNKACNTENIIFKYPFQNPKLSWEKRVDDLVKRLTLEEIANQTLAKYTPKPYSHTPAIPRLGIKPYVWISECLHGELKHNTTAFPQSLGLAASFSNALLYNVSTAISYEVRAHWNGNRKLNKYVAFAGLSCFSPVINIMRHPLWGRNQETYGEDPFLSGVLVEHFVAGLQGHHNRYVRANAGCKHFDVHGGPENIPVSRWSFDAKVSMRDWRMTFLPAFKKCVEAGSYSLMCSYNSINGVPACANKQLLTDITRKEWGFKGYIVSDADAVIFIMQHHKYTNNSVDTVTASIKAGCNLELASQVYLSQIEAVKQGKLTEAEVRDNVKPLFYTRMRLGEFDPEDQNPYNKINMTVVQSPLHQELAIKAATMSFVLLKNTGNFLPLTKTKIAVGIIGPMANNTNLLFGSYASNVVRKFTKTPLEGLQHLGALASYASGCDDTRCRNYSPEDIYSAVLKRSLIVVCLGLGSNLEAEGHDRSSLNLPGKQLQLLQDAVKYANGTPIILLLFNAGPLDISWAIESSGVTAIMECFYPGQATGDALYRVLKMHDQSVVVPAGRLPATWPTDLRQVPPITNYSMDGHTYRYYHGDPLYPFGYGLSYTTFHYTNLKVSSRLVAKGDNVTVHVTVTNTGQLDADEVVQMYISWTNTSVPTPKLQLAGFDRVFLAAGTSRTVIFKITAEKMQVWIDDSTGFGILTGDIVVYTGGQQPNQKVDVGSNVLKAIFTVQD